MKRCSTCKLSKAYFLFHKNRAAKDGHSNECKECAKERAKKWRKLNPLKVYKWVKENPDRVKYLRDRFRKKNKTKLNLRNKKFHKNYIESLHDRYIKNNLIKGGIPRNEIDNYPELIELNRLLIKNKRELKK